VIDALMSTIRLPDGGNNCGDLIGLFPGTGIHPRSNGALKIGFAGSTHAVNVRNPAN
jgi:hypothetical protein